ncbi:MAG: GAP family protein [Actinobacteria bacterium]|nr:GAP family protein [Actinomycetota bacterium]
MIVIGLGAAVSPVAFMVLISLMLLKHPLKNALFYLAGFTLVLVCMGLVGALVFHASGSGGKGTVDSWIDLILGALCLLAIIPALTRKPAPERKERGELKGYQSFLIGAGAMAVNTSTIVIYMSGVHHITRAGLGAAEAGVALLVLTAVTLVTLVAPMLLYAVFPKAGEKVLIRMRTWLGKYHKVIGVGILLVFGAYLLIKGILALV